MNFAAYEFDVILLPMSLLPAPPPEPSSPQRWPRLTLGRMDQAVAAVIIALGLAAIAGWCIAQGRLRGRLIDIDTAEPIAIEFKIDVNAADWPERTTGNLSGTG